MTRSLSSVLETLSTLPKRFSNALYSGDVGFVFMRYLIARLEGKAMSEYQGPNLGGLVGQTVGMLVPTLEANQTIRVKIHAVEASGVWIESQMMIEKMLATLGKTYGAATPLFFLPFSSVGYIVASIALPSLSETMIAQ